MVETCEHDEDPLDFREEEDRFVGFELLAAEIMISTVFWNVSDIVLSTEIHRRFGGNKTIFIGDE